MLFLDIAGVLSLIAGVGLWVVMSPILGASMLVVSAVFLTGRVITGEIRHLRDDQREATERVEAIQEDGLESVLEEDAELAEAKGKKRDQITGVVIVGVILLLFAIALLTKDG